MGRRVELVLLVIAAGLDLFTTLWNIRAYGPSIEVHPVQRFVVHALGVEAGVPIAKLIQVGFVIVVSAWWTPWCRWVLIVCAVLYALAAANNYWHWL